jgi:hypothetical protein
MRWVGHVVLMREKRSAHKVLIEKLYEKGLLRRSRHRWKDNIELDPKDIGW